MRISRILRANLVHLERSTKQKAACELNMTEEGGCMGKYNICELDVQGGFVFHSSLGTYLI